VGLGYLYEPRDSGIRLRADYISLSGNELSAWLAAEASDGSHFHRARVKLSSTQARQVFARQTQETYHKLNSRWPIDWSALVEVFCCLVEDAERSVGQVINVSAIESPAVLPDQIGGFIPAGKVTWLYGPGGSGKGHIAVLAALCVASGVNCFGRPVQRGNVLYCDWEDDEHVMALRVSAIAAGIGLAQKPPFFYLSMASPLREHVNEIARVVAENDIALVVYDSARYAIGGSESSDTDAFINAVRYIGVTSLVIDHVSKETIKDKSKLGMPIGDSGKWNAARAAWEIRKDQEDGSSTSFVALYNAKQNYAGNRQPIGLRIDFEELDGDGHAHRIVFRREDVHQSMALSQVLSLPDRIAYVLKSGAKSVKEIATALDADETAVRVACNRSRRFTHLSDSNLWGLAAS
jgi:RecA-family ATPase